jgi:hypothetical protein
MKIATRLIQSGIRVLGLFLLVLGFMFWSGRSFEMVPVHMRFGEVLVSLLWILAAIGLRAGLKPALVLGAMLYGVIVLAFAFRMGTFLPGRAHEAIRVLHFLLGVGAIGLAESIGVRIRRGLAR